MTAQPRHTPDKAKPGQRDIDRALASAIKQGLSVRRYRVTADGVEVWCGQEESGDDLDLVDWKK